jgi:IclR family transcriptional regulator, KDG regulon repressor
MKQENVKSLTKVLDILELFVKTKREMALSEISKSLGLNKATVKRIISTLVQRGYIYQKEKRGKYFLGTIYLNFSGVVKSKMQIRDIAVPHLVKLSNELNEAVILSLINGKNTMLTETFYDPVHFSHTLKAIPDESAEVLLHCTALGKIALASYSDEELQEYFNTHEIKQCTSNTIVDINKMKIQLATIRQEGVAFDDEEESQGVRGVAAGLVNGEGKLVGSIGVIAPSVRLTRAKMRKLAPIVKNCAFQISNRLGFIKPIYI